MTGIKVDAAWVGGYAKLTANSAQALSDGVRTLATDPLSGESFGELGRATGAMQAYGKAAQLLHTQLQRAVEALNAASDGLEKVTAVYQDTEESGMRAIRRELQ